MGGLTKASPGISTCQVVIIIVIITIIIVIIDIIVITMARNYMSPKCALGSKRIRRLKSHLFVDREASFQQQVCIGLVWPIGAYIAHGLDYMEP